MNKYYKRYFDSIVQDQSQKQEAERSFGQQMLPVMVAGTIGVVFIHILSFCAAVIYPAYQVDVMTGYFSIGLIVGAAGVFTLIEIPKFVFTKTVFENYFQSGIISYGMALIAFCFFAVSILSSTNGVPLAVNRLSPDAVLISLDDIESKYNQEREQALAFWTPQIEKHSTEADEYFSTYAKYYESEDRIRLTSSGNVRETHASLEADESNARKDLNSQLKDIEFRKNQEIKEAKIENVQRKESHEYRKNNAGEISFWLMLALEFIYVLYIAGKYYYKDRCKREQQESPTEQESTGVNRTEQESTQQDTTRVVPLKTQQEQDQTEQPNKDDSQEVRAKQNKTKPIGFQQHGSVFMPDKGTEPRVRYQTKKGAWKEYTAAEMRGMAKKKTASESWKKELESLALKADKFKAKNKG
jgi:hypothetical protein